MVKATKPYYTGYIKTVFIYFGTPGTGYIKTVVFHFSSIGISNLFLSKDQKELSIEFYTNDGSNMFPKLVFEFYNTENDFLHVR